MFSVSTSFAFISAMISLEIHYIIREYLNSLFFQNFFSFSQNGQKKMSKIEKSKKVLVKKVNLTLVTEEVSFYFQYFQNDTELFFAFRPRKSCTKNFAQIS